LRRVTVRRFAPNVSLKERSLRFGLRPKSESLHGSAQAFPPLVRSLFRKASPFGFRFSAPNVSLKERALRFGRQKGNRGSGEYTSTSGAHFGASPAQSRCKPLLLLDSRSTLTTWHSGIAS
jgi:hypothetical protein